MKAAKLAKIKNELLNATIALEKRFCEEYSSHRMEYMQVDYINVIANYIKTLEYHYRDNVARKPTKTKHPEYAKAMSLFGKYFELIDPKNDYSEYKLKREYEAIYPSEKNRCLFKDLTKK